MDFKGKFKWTNQIHDQTEAVSRIVGDIFLSTLIQNAYY